METVVAFIIGLFIGALVVSIVFGSFHLESEERAYKKGFEDGKNRKSDGYFPGMREVTKGTRNL